MSSDETNLIDLFESMTQTEFVFLGDEYGFKFANVDKKERVICIRYESQKVAMSLSYNTLHFDIDLRFGEIEKYNKEKCLLFDTSHLLCSKGNGYDLSHTGLVCRPHTLNIAVKDLASIWKTYGKHCLLGEKKAFKELGKIREDCASKIHLQYEMREIRNKLQVAWKQKRYNEIVRLLVPQKNQLSQSELRKLEYAEKQLNE